MHVDELFPTLGISSVLAKRELHIRRLYRLHLFPLNEENGLGQFSPTHWKLRFALGALARRHPGGGQVSPQALHAANQGSQVDQAKVKRQ